MPAKNNIGRVIIWLCAFGIVLLVFMYLRGCGKKENQPSATLAKTDTVYLDSIRTFTIMDTEYVPKPYKVKESDRSEHNIILSSGFDSVYAAALEQAYYRKSYYKDTVVNDSSALVVVSDTISENRIMGRGVKASIENKIITQMVTITEVQPRRVTGYVGGKIGGNKVHPFSLGSVTGGLMDKKGRYYGAAYSIILNQRPVYELQVMVPVRLKR